MERISSKRRWRLETGASPRYRETSGVGELRAYQLFGVAGETIAYLQRLVATTNAGEFLGAPPGSVYLESLTIEPPAVGGAQPAAPGVGSAESRIDATVALGAYAPLVHGPASRADFATLATKIVAAAEEELRRIRGASRPRSIARQE
jgi:hypothetical protein